MPCVLFIACISFLSDNFKPLWVEGMTSFSCGHSLLCVHWASSVRTFHMDPASAPPQLGGLLQMRLDLWYIAVIREEVNGTGGKEREKERKRLVWYLE